MSHNHDSTGVAGEPGSDPWWLNAELELRRRLLSGIETGAEEYLSQVSVNDSDQFESALDLIYAEYLTREELGQQPVPEVFQTRFPAYADNLTRQIELHNSLIQSIDPLDCVKPTSELPPDQLSLAERRGDPSGVDTPTDDNRLARVADPPPGYEVIGVLGRGSTSTVYLARDHRLHRDVALKMMHCELLTHARIHRFQTEAQAVARLQHPNIVQVFEVGEHHGVPYLVLERVNGGTLADLIQEQPVPTAYVAGVGYQLAEALDHAHQRGVLHRDLKPANILLARGSFATVTPHGREAESISARKSVNAWLVDVQPRITDFGLAKLFDVGTDSLVTSRTGDEGLNATRHGDLLGTPAYMSPEQLRRDTQEIADATDVYGLGSILYEMLTGHPPFRGTTFWDVTQQVLNDDPAPPDRAVRSISSDFSRIVLKCLEKDPTRRYPSARALADDIGRFRNGMEVQARPRSPWRRTMSWFRRSPWRTAFVILCALLLLCLPAFIWLNQSDRRATQALVLVESLADADPEHIEAVFGRLDALQPESLRVVHEQARSELAEENPVRFSVELWLLLHGKGDPSAVAEMIPTLSAVELNLFGLASNCVGFQEVTTILRRHLAEQPTTIDNSGAARLRQVAALAADTARPLPLSNADATLVGRIAEQLVREKFDDRHLWSALTQRLSGPLRSPLHRIFLDRTRPINESLMAAAILKGHHADNPEFLAELLVSASEAQYRLLYSDMHWPTTPKQLSGPAERRLLERLRQTAVSDRLPSDLELPEINETASRSLMVGTPFSPDQVREQQRQLLENRRRICWHRRQALAALTLARNDIHEPLLNLLNGGVDRTAGSFAVNLASLCGVPADVILRLWQTAPSDDSRRELLLMIGNYQPADLSTACRTWLHVTAAAEVRRSEDPGLNSALDWALRRVQPPSGLSVEPDPPATEINSATIRNWLITSRGRKFAILPIGNFTTGSPTDEIGHDFDEIPATHSMSYRLAVQPREVTVRDMLEFRPDFQPNVRYSPLLECPVNNVNWFEAAAYCRWLSEQEQIAEDQMCFPPLPEIRPGMRLPKDYLQRTGYRLPAEVEWEYACRAGTSSPWSFGMAPELLPEYGFCLPQSRDRSWPTGMLKPNAFGLYDMHGNVTEWCMDHSKNPGSGDSQIPVTSASLMRTRGGAFGDINLALRSTRRLAQPAGAHWANTGFRVVRTMPASEPK